MYLKIEEKQQNLSEFLFWHQDYYFLLQMNTGSKYRLYVIEWKVFPINNACYLVTKNCRFDTQLRSGDCTAE